MVIRPWWQIMASKHTKCEIWGTIRAVAKCKGQLGGGVGRSFISALCKPGWRQGYPLLFCMGWMSGRDGLPSFSKGEGRVWEDPALLNTLDHVPPNTGQAARSMPHSTHPRHHLTICALKEDICPFTSVTSFQFCQLPQANMLPFSFTTTRREREQHRAKLLTIYRLTWLVMGLNLKPGLFKSFSSCSWLKFDTPRCFTSPSITRSSMAWKRKTCAEYTSYMVCLAPWQAMSLGDLP